MIKIIADTEREAAYVTKILEETALRINFTPESVQEHLDVLSVLRKSITVKGAGNTYSTNSTGAIPEMKLKL
ncbi:MAG: hypothetical protein LBK23_02560 [Oscillospiraceae bacterium]|jgi:hypothetical protein|nr:hypothetical protein [Oscillospiraceae bacterium]